MTKVVTLTVVLLLLGGLLVGVLWPGGDTRETALAGPVGPTVGTPGEERERAEAARVLAAVEDSDARLAALDRRRAARDAEAASVPRVELAAVRERTQEPDEQFDELMAAVEELRADTLTGPLLRASYPNGQLHFLGYQALGPDGRWLREGDWEAWHENGGLHELGAYRDDVENGSWRWWYEDGTPMAVGRFVAGARDGAWVWWHESGALMMEGTYREGWRVGVWRTYDDAGQPLGERLYVEGERPAQDAGGADG